MVAKKRKSKRQTLQKKYKIQKRVKEHKKRQKKGVIAPGTKGTKKRAENHIPNAWPYKEQLLNEIQAAKEKMEELRLRHKEKRTQEIKERRARNDAVAAGTSMDTEEDSDSDDKAKPQISFDKVGKWDGKEEKEVVGDDSLEDLSSKNLGQNSRRAYLGELRKTVERADVILHVLDARDPLGTKSIAIEEMVLANPQKKLVFLLNKADLVPKDVLAAWLAYLRKSCPALPFKSNTQAQKEHLGRAVGKVTKQQEGALKTNQAVGAEELIGLLKNYCRVGDTKSIISVGVVGFPNVGKSSLINSLLRSRAVGVSSVPGFTKQSQEVILDKNIRLIDSPGIVFADGDSAATALRNCVNVEEMVDVLTPVQAILERCPQSYLMQLYAIPKFKSSDCMGFLALVARVTGKLKKGGIPNTDAAARTLLHDWNTGKIKYYCKPPAASSNNGGGAGEVDSKVLSAFSAEMDVDALRDQDIRVLDAIEASARGDDASFTSSSAASAAAAIPSFAISKPIAGGVALTAVSMSVDDDDDDEEDGDLNGDDGRIDDDEASVATAGTGISRANKPSAKKTTEKKLKKAIGDDEQPSADPRKQQKKLKKKNVKDSRRNQSTEEGGYDFDNDFQY